MKKSLFKKGLVTMVVALSMVFVIVAMTACASAPSWANNPANPNAFRRSAEDAGWEVEVVPAEGIELFAEMMGLEGLTGAAMAERASHDLDDEDVVEGLSDNTTVWIEMLVVMWFENDDYARAALDILNEEDSDFDDVPDGIRVTETIRRNGSTITGFVRLQGNWSLMGEDYDDED